MFGHIWDGILQLAPSRRDCTREHHLCWSRLPSHELQEEKRPREKEIKGENEDNKEDRQKEMKVERVTVLIAQIGGKIIGPDDPKTHHGA